MTPEDYEELVQILDGRIDKLTKPIPSQQILRFAKAIESADPGDYEAEGTFTNEDYSNLLEAQIIVNACLPRIIEAILARSIDPETGWRFEPVKAGNGDYGLCSICKSPFQHFRLTVKVHCLDMHPNAYHGVCRECVRQYATLEFIESEGVEDWLSENRWVSPKKIEQDHKTEGHRIALIDAIRRHAHSTHYAADIAQNASEWAAGSFGEWR